jgi:hypothetical protein
MQNTIQLPNKVRSIFTEDITRRFTRAAVKKKESVIIIDKVKSPTDRVITGGWGQSMLPIAEVEVLLSDVISMENKYNFLIHQSDPSSIARRSIAGEIFHLLCRIRDNCRIVVVPSSESYEFQKNLNKRISKIRSHPSVYGFVRGKNTFDCASAHVDYHNGAPELLINIDIKNFFNSFSSHSIIESLTAHGFSEEEVNKIVENCTIKVEHTEPWIHEAVKKLLLKTASSFIRDRVGANLGKLCSTIASAYCMSLADKSAISASASTCLSPRANWAAPTPTEACSLVLQLIKCGPNTGLGSRMLFQGGPSSPAISNLCFKLLDYRLDGLARACDGFYTRYADDLCFSFSKRKTKKAAKLFVNSVSNILKDGGFEKNNKKVSINGGSMAQDIVGYCVNSGVPKVPRSRRRKALGDIFKAEINGGFIEEKEKLRLLGVASYIRCSDKFLASKMEERINKLKIKQKNKRSIVI